MTSDLPIVACSEVLTAALRGAGAGSIEGVAVVGAGAGVGRVGSGVAVVPGAALGFHIMGPREKQCQARAGGVSELKIAETELRNLSLTEDNRQLQQPKSLMEEPCSAPVTSEKLSDFSEGLT